MVIMRHTDSLEHSTGEPLTSLALALALSLTLYGSGMAQTFWDSLEPEQNIVPESVAFSKLTQRGSEGSLRQRWARHYLGRSPEH